MAFVTLSVKRFSAPQTVCVVDGKLCNSANCAIRQIVLFLIISLKKSNWISNISYTQSENSVPTASTPLWYGYNNQSSRLNKGGVHSVMQAIVRTNYSLPLIPPTRISIWCQCLMESNNSHRFWHWTAAFPRISIPTNFIVIQCKKKVPMFESQSEEICQKWICRWPQNRVYQMHARHLNETVRSTVRPA